MKPASRKSSWQPARERYEAASQQATKLKALEPEAPRLVRPVLQRRYPFVAAGRVAAVVFGLAGLPLGWLVAIGSSDPVTAAVSAVFWGGVAAVVAYLVFSAEGPRRPPSRAQGAAADGVVVGIITTVSASVFSTLIVNQASGGASAGQVALAAGAGLVGGSLAGAALGLVALRVGGADRFTRTPQARRGAKNKRARSGRSRR